MQRYEVLLLDADGTLLDFHAAEKAAMGRCFISLGLPFDDTIHRRYSAINQSLWQQFERGEISKAEIGENRFQRVLDEFSIPFDGKRVEQAYREALGEEAQLVPGALELCRTLAERCRLYIVTNGVSKTQYRRIALSGLKGYFEEVFVSEDAGAQKPQREYFDYVFARIPGFCRERALLVGDSLTSDIQGGVNAGLDTCWYRPAGTKNLSGLRPTWEIDTLSGLAPLVLGERR
ncbi:MAG: YjjG family noncanonical pyrimidine nucleotidase [Oscillospiraceae bacterium]|nr:YjjG family noncanonical pyrimidine nucleotidase [Oscillospiraceae bacterium]